MKCPQCGSANPEDAASCVHCSARLPVGAMQWSAGGSPEIGGGASGAAPWSATMPLESVARAGARLRVEEGSVQATEFALDAPVVNIGRRLGNDIVVHDTNVSRQHARIVHEDGGHTIEDTNSANGTLLNGERVNEVRPLEHGDVIQVGDARFVFELLTSAEPDEAVVPPLSDAGRSGGGGPDAAQPRSVPAFESAEPSFEPAPSSSGPPEPAQPRWAETTDAPAPSAAAFHSEPVPFPEIAPDQVWSPADEDRPAAPASAPSYLEAGDGSRPASAAIGDAERDLGDLREELANVAASLQHLVGRADGLGDWLAAAAADLDRLGRVAGGSGGESLRELRDVLEELDAMGRAERLEASRAVLDQLAEQPRDIDLLRQLAEHANDLREIVSAQVRLGVISPDVRRALGELLG